MCQNRTLPIKYDTFPERAVPKIRSFRAAKIRRVPTEPGKARERLRNAAAVSHKRKTERQNARALMFEG